MIGSSPERWEAELRALRDEIGELRTEQKELARAVAELVTTFRSLAMHLGVAVEPYRKKGEPSSERDLSGFA